MNRWLPAAFLAALLVIGGIAYLVVAKPHFGGTKPTSQTTEQTASGRPAGAAGSQPAAVSASMTFQRLNVDTSGDRPEACLVFSQNLDASGNTSYSDYVKLDPEVQHSVRVNGNALCIGGLEYAKDYSAKILTGLPSVTGQKTTYEETVPISLSDRPAAIAFSGGIILPRESEGKIPVTSVNVASMKIKVLRVGDRLLARLSEGLVDSSELYDYDASQIEDEMGSLVWQGTMAIEGKKNQTVTTLIPLHDAIKSEKPGVYLVLASDAKEKNKIGYDENGTAAQWVIDTDIGLTSFQGADGLHIFARSLSTAKPMSGVEIALVARNNEELGRVKTDGDGEASFNADLLKGAGGDTPVVVMAYGGQDFAYLDLRRPAFDLSDRGVSGREQPGPVDAYLYLDRGIYRPGESVYVTTLLRDAFVNSVTDSPLTLIAKRPDGVEYRRIQLNGDQAKAGAYAASFPLSVTAPRGRWQIAAYVDPTSAPIGRVTFDVQDFVPERLKVTLTPKAAFYKPGDMVEVGVEGRFLYGAPASNLTGEGEMRVSVDPNPFPDLKGYHFGREEERFQDQVISLKIDPTDSSGQTTATGTLDLPNATTHPLLAIINVGLTEPGGRLTRQETKVPIRTGNVMVGIHPDFNDDWVRENTPANFEVLAVDANGKQLDKTNMSYRIVREVVHYQWYQTNGKWQWERQTRDLPVSDGKLAVAPNAPGKISATEEWGSYRVIVADNETGASSSYEFFVGWGGSAANDRPDRVAVSLDKQTYKPGEKATLTIHPPTDGKALILIASDRVYQKVLMDVPASGGTYSFTVDKKWGTGVYALVEHYRGTGEGNSRAPVRSIGLAWLGVDQSDRKIRVTIKAPDKVKPQTTVDIPVQVDGAHGKTYITLAAVDEGILQLTDFVSPSPSDYYFGKRRLGVEIRDAYGRLIQAQEGALGALRSGGDNFGGGEGLTVVPTRTVALYSGLVAVNGQGIAHVKLDIPDYVGSLRLMAVAFNDSQVGEANTDLIVRDSVVADLTLPRFLAPKDKASATLLVDNVEGPAGNYHVDVTTSGAVVTNKTSFSLNLAAKARQIVSVPITGGEPGIGTVTLDFRGPGNIRFTRAWPIEIRPGQRPATTEQVAELAPGATLTLARSLFQGYYPGTAKMSVSLASNRAYDVPALLRWLDRYPYGCIEQTTSRAYPLLVYNDLAAQAGIAQDVGVKVREQNAIDSVLDMQNGYGNFSMWGWGGSSAYDWLSVYALDFLMNAKQAGYVVPQDALNRGDSWLHGTAVQSWEPHEVRSYAMYVLAKQGAINLSDLRYYHDTQLGKMVTPMAAAHLGAALAQMGDRSRAHSAFLKAVDLASTPITEKNMPPYGSDLREVAGTTALVAQSGETDLLPKLFARTQELTTNIEDTSTQEKAWMLLAASALSKAQGPLSVAVKGVASLGKGPIYLAALTPDSVNNVEVKNTGNAKVWYTVAIDGTQINPLPAMSQGVSITKSYYTMDGQPVSLSSLKQSQRVIVVISGHMPDVKQRTMGVIDLLPAGLEVDAPLGPGAEDTYKFLPALTPTSIAQKRDDRFVAAFDIRGMRRLTPEKRWVEIIPDYAVAYIARAVTPGSFVLPAATIEDMYAPGVKARTDIGSITVTGPNG